MPPQPINQVKRSDFIAAIEHGIENFEAGFNSALTEAEIERLREIGRTSDHGSCHVAGCAGTQAGIKPLGRVIAFGKPHDRWLVHNIEVVDGRIMGRLADVFEVVDG